MLFKKLLNRAHKDPQGKYFTLSEISHNNGTLY
jgi:hypothetical protein